MTATPGNEDAVWARGIGADDEKFAAARRSKKSTAQRERPRRSPRSTAFGQVVSMTLRERGRDMAEATAATISELRTMQA
jgi:hypothetical protein